MLRVRVAALLRLDNIRLLTERWCDIFGCSETMFPEGCCEGNDSGNRLRGLLGACDGGGESVSKLSYGVVACSLCGLSSEPVHPTHGGGTSPILSSFFRFSLVLRTLRGVSGLLHAEWSLCRCRAGLSLGDNGLMCVGNGCERKALGVGGRFCALSISIVGHMCGLLPLLSSPYDCYIMM